MAVGWQPTGLMGVAGLPFCGCRLATYMFYGLLDGIWGCVGWQPTCLMGVAGWPLGL